MKGKITPPITKFLLSLTTFQTCITCITKIAQVKVIETILKDCACFKKLIENCTQCHHKTAKPLRPIPLLRLLPLSTTLPISLFCQSSQPHRHCCTVHMETKTIESPVRKICNCNSVLLRVYAGFNYMSVSSGFTNRRWVLLVWAWVSPKRPL